MKDKQAKYRKIMESKMETNMEILLDGFQHEFVDYMTYVKGLEFEEQPNYTILCKLFGDLFDGMGYGISPKYDWQV